MPINEEQEVKLKPLTFISPHYVQAHYGQGQRPINDSEDEETEQQEYEAMGDPTPAPEQFDMQEFIRRGNEVHWFVGTSMYQHNRAAQGLPPHFPPPPPWFQDPQYVPDFYSQHYSPPPPPDDVDHQ